MEHFETGVFVLLGIFIFYIYNEGVGSDIVKESKWLTGLSDSQFIRYIISCIVSSLTVIIGLPIFCAIAYVFGWMFSLFF